MKNVLIIISGILLLNCSDDFKQSKKNNNSTDSSFKVKEKEMRFYKKNAELEISNSNDSTFNFTLNANNGANVGMLEGTARFLDIHFAFYSEEDCSINFKFSEDSSVYIEQSGSCDAGAGVSYSGVYNNKIGESAPGRYSLTEKGVFKTKEIEDKFKNLTKEDYENFVASFEQISEEDSLGNPESTVFTGMVPGLGGINEGIILITQNNEIYAAILNEDKIHYFSSKSQNSIPESVQNWLNQFEDKEVIFFKE